MITYVLMMLFVIVFAFVTLWGIKYEPDKNSFMSLDDITFLRGFWCIIVVLVHIPAQFQNKIQDIIGSFAFIGVTFFFMTSAYGLTYSMTYKKDYMNHFWRRRLPSIIIPNLLINILVNITKVLLEEQITFKSFFSINPWVRVLLCFYFFFWLIYGIIPKILKKGLWQDIITCCIVLCFSVISYFTRYKITSIWIVEPLGFMYGILAFRFSSRIKVWIQNSWIKKNICLMIISLFLGALYLKYKTVYFWGNYLLKIILGLSITFFYLSLLGRFKVGNKANSFLSTVSYEIYLLHTDVFVLLFMFYNISMNSGCFVIISICITIIIAFFIKNLTTLILRQKR